MRLAVAAVVSAAVILSAPFVGQIRAALRSAFPTQFVAIVGGVVAAAIAGTILLALARIRERPAARFGAIACALVLGTSYSLAFSTGTSEVDVVERVHFVEYGVITFLFYRAFKHTGDLSMLVLPALAGVIVGTLEEWFQWFIPVRVGEARDVLLNLVAIGCGLLFSVGIDPPAAFSPRLERRSYLALAVTAAMALLVFAAFVDAVHIGYRHTDPALGTFKSRYTLDRLEALRQERAERWRRRPPTELIRMSREDHYLDEGLWHVRTRNTEWAAGDHAAALAENQILERYFTPVLDTSTYAGLDGHRWPPAQRADAEGRARATGHQEYVSHAEPYPILTWSRAFFWGVVGAMWVLIAGGCLYAPSRLYYS